MHFLDKFSLDNDVILVHRKLGQKLITLENCIKLHNATRTTQTSVISRDRENPILNLVKCNQISIKIIVFRLIWHQTDFPLI